MPDLFSTDAVGDATAPSKPIPATETAADTTQRHILPKNLTKAVKHLSDGELDLLHTATLEEMQRRGRLAPSVAAVSASPKRSPRTDNPSRQPKVDLADVPLTRGRVNAVRAAFKAGVTPSRIARQFGLSHGSVRKALASDEAKR